jgi:exopolysaccharide biosynthesis WecB/TagA/CpsF family protein
LLGIDFFTGPLGVAVDRVIGVRDRSPPPGPAAIWETLAVGVTDVRLAETSPVVAPLMALAIPAVEDEVGGSSLVVAPSGPGLAVDLVRSVAYREALTTADLVLTDSGFMVLLWRLFSGVSLPRISGLKFMSTILARPELKGPGAVFWVMPSLREDQKNRAWLAAQGFPVTAADVYVAPQYPGGGITDAELVARIEARRPRLVMLAIGGGTQERLGLMLRAQLSAPTSILCLGAAIAFLSGGQAKIPLWADRLVLGWLLRLWSSPRKFWRRYWDALDLVVLLWLNREWLPPLRR